MAVSFSVDHQRTSEYRFFPENVKINPELNGRYEKPDIEWLIADILSIDAKGKTKGQVQPVTIRNDGGTPILVAGFSRWRAISEINKRKLTPVPMQLRATYVQCSESEAFLINISENRFRNETRPLDDAHNINRLVNGYAMTEEQAAKVYFPTAATGDEMKKALKFIRERLALISLTPEAEAAVRSGRVKENAASAIAKLSEEQQHEVLKKEGTIERKDLRPAKAKPASKMTDRELIRRISSLLDDVDENELRNETYPDAVVSREKLIALYDYWMGNE